MTAESQNEYYLVTKDELWNIRNDCQHPESDSCDGCELWKDDDCTFIGANILIEDVVLKRPYKSSDKVLDELERRISGRYKELTELLPCETAKEMCKILALIGENEAMWAQIKELRTKER